MDLGKLTVQAKNRMNCQTLLGNDAYYVPDLTDDEVRGVIAFLKWMSAMDTNGFPHNFEPLPQRGA